VGLPLPPELRSGDVLDLADMEFRSRVLFTNSSGNPPAGTIINLVVKRAGQPLSIATPLVLDRKAGENLFIFVLYFAQTWLYAGLGLLLLWRGRRQATAAVGMWCLLNAVANVITGLPLPLLLSELSGLICNDLVVIGTLVALYLLADDLTQDGVTAVTRLRMRWTFVLACSAYTASLMFTHVITAASGVAPPYFRVIVLVHLLAFAIPLGLLTLSYRKTPPADRARVRWVLASMLLFIAAYLAGVFAFRFLDSLQNNLLITSLTAAAVLGLTYAVLRHRLVSLNLVLNRALVYGVITSLVVGIFAAISAIVDHFAIGRTESALLQLLVPLTLGVTLNMVKKRLDALVERFFFQRQYQAEAALSRFARECGFIESLETLLDRTRDEVFEHLRATGVALYEGTPSGYVCLRQRGSRLFPQNLSSDDPALVSLRANLAEADLDRLKSALGNEGLVFPLAVRGILSGVLVIGQRPAEQYTQSERALLARLAAQVAAAIHSLRAKEAEAFVGAVARGALAAAPETRSKARELLNQQLATAA
jgi:GAF domain-containing protein